MYIHIAQKGLCATFDTAAVKTRFTHPILPSLFMGTLLCFQFTAPVNQEYRKFLENICMLCNVRSSKMASFFLTLWNYEVRVDSNISRNYSY